MLRLVFDASALAKRYAPELGTALVNRIFEIVPATSMSCLMLGAAEVAFVLVKRHNEGRLSDAAYALAHDELLREVIHSRQFSALPFGNEEVISALPFLGKHHINATDAVLLRVVLDLRSAAEASGHQLALVASDERLLRAAKAEGVPVFDPERQPQAELEALPYSS